MMKNLDGGMIMIISRNFYQLLQGRWAKGLFLCVGLDLDIDMMPSQFRKSSDGAYDFVCGIIDATAEYACAFKLNRTFYDGIPKNRGTAILARLIRYIQEQYPDIPIILDQKRDDIGKTNLHNVEQIVAGGFLQADAVTVHPTFGQEGLQPFLDCKDKGIFVLCKTSNEGSREFQSKRIEIGWVELSNLTEGVVDLSQWNERARFSMIQQDKNPMIPFYQYVALRVAKVWNTNNNCGLVVGATYPMELAQVRELVGDGFPLLIPGIGAQGGDLAKTVAAGQDSNGSGMIINASSSIIYASRDHYFARAAAREAESLHLQIQECLV